MGWVPAFDLDDCLTRPIGSSFSFLRSEGTCSKNSIVTVFFVLRVLYECYRLVKSKKRNSFDVTSRRLSS